VLVIIFGTRAGKLQENEESFREMAECFAGRME